MTIVTVTETQATVSITEKGATTVVPTVSATGVEVNQAGVPPGGNPKDLLVKSSGTDYHSEWTSTPEVNALQFDLTAGVEPANGQVVWNADTVTIPKGTAVMFAGTLGASGRIKVAPMVADGSQPGYVFFGVTDQPILGASDGYVSVFGKIRGINTSGYAEGAILWCNPAVPGGFTATEPQAPNLKLPVAAVISSRNNGTIFVRWDTGRRLQDLHDVEANGSKSDGDALSWNAAANRWEPTDRLTLLEARVAALEAPTYLVTQQ
jgi:hypothetical protein